MSIIPGQTFHQWTALRLSRKTLNGKQIWLCRCACGAEKEVEAYNLVSGRSKSCRKCSSTKVSELYVRTHGKTLTREYTLWLAMKTRCYNDRQPRTFKYHGAIGVKVCPEWLNDFPAFLRDMGPAPSKRHTLNRIDPFGDYAPGNVEWATQADVVRTSRKIALTLSLLARTKKSRQRHP
jgi:hypothetical protein